MSRPETAEGLIAWESFRACEEIPAALALGRAKGADEAILADYLIALAEGACDGAIEAANAGEGAD